MKLSTKYTIYLIIGIVVVFTVIAVGTYAIFKQSRPQNSTNMVSTLDCVNISITGNNSPLTLNNVYPLTNQEGLNQTPYNFIVKNNCDSYVEYQIIMSVVNTSTITNKEYVKVDLEGPVSIRNQKISQLLEEPQQGLAGQGFTNNYTLITNSFVGDENHTYNFRMWLNGENEAIWTDDTISSKTITVKLSIIGVTKTFKMAGSLKEKILAQGGGTTVIEAKGTPDFSKIPVSQTTYDSLPETATLPEASKATAIIENGLYATDDEYGMSYYYRGDKDLLNNNLIFGGFQWKIVRINGDGTIRIIYNGTETQFNQNKTMNKIGNNTSIGSYSWNTLNTNDAKYIGYMYGGANGAPSTVRNGATSEAATYNETSSNAKIQLDNWYQKNISGKAFESKIADNIYCNDRQLRSEVGGAATGPGYGTSNTNYASDYRLNTNKIPTLKCGLKNDRFTKNDIILGNGALIYPIGLISADETSYGGVVADINNNTNYLQTFENYWTFTPYKNSGTTASVKIVTMTAGTASINIMTDSMKIRPVLNLLSDVTVIGDGSATNPFKVQDNPTLKEKIIAQGGGKASIEAKGNPDFSQISTSSDTGLYAALDEYGTSYYYRGDKDILNNNLIYGGFQWKIIRSNGDESIRIIYNGTEAQFNTNGTMNIGGADTQISGTISWNTFYNTDAKYVGYMYGGANGVASTVRNGTTSAAATYNETSSNAKAQVDAWYLANISGKPYESKLVDNLFCNDRRLNSEVGGAATGPGYGNTTTYYASKQLIEDTKSPTLKCGQKNDRFTVSDTTVGNGSLTYPVGLMTGSEAAMAGMIISTTNPTNYLNTNQDYWLSTPGFMIATSSPFIYKVSSNGSLGQGIVTGVAGIRPVLNLSPDVIVSGEGTATNPFKVK